MRAEAQPSTWWWHKCKAHKEAMLMKLDSTDSKKTKEICKDSNYLWFAWNDTPVQQHLYWCFFGWFCYDHFRPPVSPWGILRTGYKTRSPLKPLGNLDQFDSHFTDFQHLSRSATFDLWTTNLRGSFLLVKELSGFICFDGQKLQAWLCEESFLARCYVYDSPYLDVLL